VERTVRVVESLFKANDAIAQRVRARFDELGIFCLNIMGTPGSGKTTILEKTFEMLGESARAAVIEGDVSTAYDAERLSQYGIQVALINTDRLGGACHLDASMILSALDELDLSGIDFLVIENIGNLICPATFDLGEHARAVVFSVTEGDDKPLKYPKIFADADLVVVNKIDLVDHTDCDLSRIEKNIAEVNPKAKPLFTSARTGEGLDTWLDWLTRKGDLV
jgi:hydrogenase nickel incorporation protein HypB